MLSRSRVAKLFRKLGLEKTSGYKTARMFFRYLNSLRYGYHADQLYNRTTLGNILSFENVLVLPYQYLLDGDKDFSEHCGGPVWPNWSAQLEARHCRNGFPIDDLPKVPKNIRYERISSGSWCGAVVNHYGHQIADFSTRILHARKFNPEVKLLFSTKNVQQAPDPQKTPHFFRSILDWYDVCLDDITIIAKPTIVNRLFVAPQSEQLRDYGPSSEYLDLLDEHVEKRLSPKPKQGSIFVSRAGLESKNHFAGEAYLEHIFEMSGVKVIRPETLPLEAQLAEYEASEQIVFSEGSALHSLQLLGRCLDQVTVLTRRPGNRLAERLIKPRATGLNYVEASREMIYVVTPTGEKNIAYGIAVFHEDNLMSFLRSINPTLLRHWNPQEYRKLRDNDIVNWLEKALNTEHHRDINLVTSTIKRTLGNAQLTHLLPLVDRYWGVKT